MDWKSWLNTSSWAPTSGSCNTGRPAYMPRTEAHRWHRYCCRTASCFADSGHCRYRWPVFLYAFPVDSQNCCRWRRYCEWMAACIDPLPLASHVCPILAPFLVTSLRLNPTNMLSTLICILLKILFINILFRF